MISEYIEKVFELLCNVKDVRFSDLILQECNVSLKMADFTFKTLDVLSEKSNIITFKHGMI
jgi:hypothetical protein